MKKFSFQLNTLYRIQMQKEEEMRIKLGEASVRCQTIKEKILNHASEIRRTSEQDIHLLYSRESYLNRLRSEIQEFNTNYEEAEEKHKEAMASYLLAQRNFKTIEMLRNKRLSEYKKQIAKEEILEVNDIVSSKRGLYGS